MERYRNLSHLPLLPQSVIQEALNAEYVMRTNPQVLRARANLFVKTEFFKKLCEKFPNSHTIENYQKTPPMSIYDWHIDSRRSCSLNWVIKTNPFARTLYKFDSIENSIYSIENIEYELHKPTLMRVWVPHCVINPYPGERIILCLTVREASYDKLKDYLMNLNIEDY
jgi:hypothetical protein